MTVSQKRKYIFSLFAKCLIKMWIFYILAYQTDY